MRTTLTLDEDVLKAARVLAQERNRSLGSVISELARKGLRPGLEAAYRGDFPVFEVREDSPVFGPDEVRQALEDE